MLIHRKTQCQDVSSQRDLQIQNNLNQNPNKLFADIEEKNKAGEQTPSNFKTYHKATAINTVWLQKKNREIAQRDRTESSEIGPRKCSYLILNKRAKAIQEIKDSHFTNWCWNN